MPATEKQKRTEVQPGFAGEERTEFRVCCESDMCVNSQSKFHSKKAVAFSMRKVEVSMRKMRKKQKKGKRKTQEGIAKKA